MAELFRIWLGWYQPTWLYLWAGFHHPVKPPDLRRWQRGHGLLPMQHAKAWLSIQLFVYTFCMNFVYKLYTWCTLFVHQNWCIQNVYKMVIYKMCPNFPQTFVYKMYIYKMFVYKIYTAIRQIFVYILYTKFSWHTSFDFVYKMYTKVCWNVVYILHTSVAYILYNICIKNVYTVFVWDISYSR